MKRTPNREINPGRDGKLQGVSRVRRILVAATAVSLSLLFTFAVLEFGLARFYYSNIDVIREDEFDQELGWRLKPGSYTVKAPQAFFTHNVFINQMGIRHAELAPVKPAETRRIIVLGDSFTFGQAVDNEALFSTQLQQRLNTNHHGSRFEVINAGVPGYGTAQELVMLRRLANAGIVGDIYVLNIFTNDILDNLRLDYSSRSQNPVQPGFELDRHGNLVLVHTPQPVLQEGSNLVAVQKPPVSMLFSLVKARLQTLAQTKPRLVKLAGTLGMDITVARVPGVISAWYDADVLAKGIPLMKALLAEMNATIRSRQGVLLISIIASPMQVYTDTYGEVLRASFPDDPNVERFLADPTRAQRIVRSICEELQIPFLDMRDVMIQKNQAFYFPTDGHFNEAGHAIFAASLEPFVIANVPRAH